jgi:hypothetical protein
MVGKLDRYTFKNSSKTCAETYLASHQNKILKTPLSRSKGGVIISKDSYYDGGLCKPSQISFANTKPPNHFISSFILTP